MSFENGLKPKRDLLKNAQNSPFFAKLSGELRDAIYILIFKQTSFEKDVRRGQLSPSALRTCRQFYLEAVGFLYACNEHSFSIDPDMVISRAVPRIPSQFISIRNIGMIERVELELQLCVRTYGTSPTCASSTLKSGPRPLRPKTREQQRSRDWSTSSMSGWDTEVKRTSRSEAGRWKRSEPRFARLRLYMPRSTRQGLASTTGQ